MNLQAFAQDDYKILPQLTLNFGVRYMNYSRWTEICDRFANFDPPLMHLATA